MRKNYFQVPIIHMCDSLSRGIACEFVVLPCGLSPSPMMFVRCTEAAVGTTQQKGI